MGPLVAPMPVEEFFGTFWRRQPVQVKQAAFEPPVIVPADYEALRSETLRVVRTTAKGPREVPPTMNLNEAVQQGFTVVDRNVERRSPQLAALLKTLAGQLKAKRAWGNLYVTPAQAQGFPVHQDSNEGFLFQLSGSKQWTLYRPSSSKQVYAQSELTAHDLLYIPSGWYHAARAGNDVSIHLTLAFEWSSV